MYNQPEKNAPRRLRLEITPEEGQGYPEQLARAVASFERLTQQIQRAHLRSEMQQVIDKANARMDLDGEPQR